MIRRLLLCTLVLLLGMATRAQDNDTREITFGLPFVPNVQFAPVYVSIEQGYFADAGFDIVVEYGEENVMVDLVDAGELPFAMVSGEQVILARAGDREVVFVYEWFQQYPVGVVVPDNSDIETVADLAGRRVGIPGLFGASYSGFVALLAANDMSEADVVLEPIGFNAPEVFCLDVIDAAVIYVNNEPLQIEQRANAGDCGDVSGVRVLPVAGAVDLVANGVTTSAARITDDPALVSGVVSAFDEGLRDTIANPAEAYLLSAPYIDGLPLGDDFRAALEVEAAAQRDLLATDPDAETLAQSRADMLARLEAEFDAETLIQFRVLLATLPLWEAETPGFTDPESWVATQAVLLEMGLIDEAIDLEAAYSNAFIPGASDG